MSITPSKTSPRIAHHASVRPTTDVQESAQDRVKAVGEHSTRGTGQHRILISPGSRLSLALDRPPVVYHRLGLCPRDADDETTACASE